MAAYQFRLRRLKDGRHKLVWLRPFDAPSVSTLLARGLREWIAAQKQLVMRDGNQYGGTIESRPQSITLGYYGPDGFSPVPRWIGALRDHAVQARILSDAAKLGGLDRPEIASD